MGNSLHRGPAGETGDVYLLGLLTEKEGAYPGSFFLDRKYIKN